MTQQQRTFVWILAALITLSMIPAPVAVADDEAGTSPSQEAGQRLQAVRSNEFFYQSYGKRDPFAAIVDGRYEATKNGELVDVNAARLVGVVWGNDDQFALVENGEGFGYILRVGDRVANGRVVSIRKNRLTARLTLYGISNTVVLNLEKREDM